MSKVTEISRQIEYINTRLSQGAHLSPEELSEEMKAEGFDNCSVPTLYRRLRDMKANYGKYDTDDLGRWYSVDGESVILPSYITNVENVRNIQIIRNLVESLSGTPVYEKASKLFNELTRVLPAEKSFSPSATSRILFLGAPASEVKDSVWKDIFTAMEKNSYISIEYKTHGHSQSKSLSVKPLQLVFDNGLWDLWAEECISKEFRLYNLSRIKRVTLKKETFTLPDNFDFLKITSGAFGAYRDIPGLTGPGMTRYSIWLAKDSYAEQYATERIWGPEQDIEQKDNGIIISFNGNQMRPILRWILGWGASARPIAPRSLVDEWKKEINSIKEI